MNCAFHPSSCRWGSNAGTTGEVTKEIRPSSPCSATPTSEQMPPQREDVHTGHRAQHDDCGSLDYARVSSCSNHTWRTRANGPKAPLRAEPKAGNLVTSAPGKVWWARLGGLTGCCGRGGGPRSCSSDSASHPSPPPQGHAGESSWENATRTLRSPPYWWCPAPNFREQHTPGTGRAPGPGSVTAG